MIQIQYPSRGEERERKREREDTQVRMYPVVIARSGSRREHAAKTEVMPAAVPSIVFSNKGKIAPFRYYLTDDRNFNFMQFKQILTACFAPAEDSILVPHH